MQACTHCHREVADSAERCPECGSTLSACLAPPDVLPAARAGDQFVRAGSAPDPLTAQELEDALEAAGIPVMVHEGRGSSVDLLTTGMLADWFELWVPAQRLEQARQCLTELKARLAETEPEAERAAEEEAAGEGGPTLTV